VLFVTITLSISALSFDRLMARTVTEQWSESPWKPLRRPVSTTNKLTTDAAARPSVM